MGAPIRVLVVEDSEDDTTLLMRELRRSGYEPIYIRVDTPDTMKSALHQDEWDIVISDYYMPGFSGLDAFHVLRDSSLDIPFIIVSGKIGEDTAVEAMRAGVQDYIMKDNLRRLAPAVQRELRDAGVRQEHRRTREELRRYREHLEELVRERTAELTREIELLQIEVSERERVENALREWLRQFRELEENVKSSYNL
jgi:DNA-binding NtrC family response regulator